MKDLPGLIFFRIRIGKRNFVNILIAREGVYQQVDKALRRGFSAAKPADTFSARCYQYKSGKAIATVLFRIKHIGSGTVAHEMLHVAFHHLTARRGRVTIGSGSEERLAELVGELVRVFWKKFYSLEKSGRIQKIR